jgi:lipoteichoic acid synthase
LRRATDEVGYTFDIGTVDERSDEPRRESGGEGEIERGFARDRSRRGVAATAGEGARRWLAGAVLLALLVLRIDRVLIAGTSLQPAQWLAFLAPEVCVAVALLGVLSLGPRLGIGTRASWIVAAIVLLPALVAAQYFVHTGTPLAWPVLKYAIVHAGSLGGLLSTGVDVQLLLRVALLAALCGFGFRLDARRRSAPWSPRVGLGLVVLGVVGYAGSVQVHGPWPGRHSLAFEAFTGGDGLVATGTVLDPDTLYQPPVVEGRVEDGAPNLLVVVLESTRRDVIAPYGPAEAASVTPFLSSLAARATVVDHAYVTTSHTSKALVGLLCGMYPHPSMEIVEPHHLPLRCLPELLQSAGYRTAFFQSALGTFEDRRELAAQMGFSGIFTQEDMASDAFAPVGYVAMDEHVMLEPIVRFTEQGGAPFFAAVLTSVPHHPYEVPPPVPPGAAAGSELAYGASVRHVDAFLQALFDRLRAAGVLDRTVVMLVADHGEAFGDHERRQHDAVPYDEVVAVPWLLVGEAFIGAPRRIDGLRSHLDLLPTALGIAGVSWTGVVPGRDLLESPGHDEVFTSCWFDTYCASSRRGDTKLVHHFGRQAPEHFDLSADPHELEPAQVPPAELAAFESRYQALNTAIEAVHAREAPERAPPPPPSRPAAARPQCMGTCVADTSSDLPGLQHECSVREIAPDGSAVEIPPCENGAPPGDAAACFFGRSDRELPRLCAQRGLNMELRISRVRPPAKGAVIDASCRASPEPAEDCDPARLLSALE